MQRQLNLLTSNIENIKFTQFAYLEFEFAGKRLKKVWTTAAKAGKDTKKRNMLQPSRLNWQHVSQWVYMMR